MTALWQQVLDDLEHELEAVEGALDAAPGGSGDAAALPQAAAWPAPEGLTRIPSHLVPRAVELLTRQDAVLARLSEAASQVRRQIAFVSSVDADAHDPAPAVFLDQAL